MLGYRSVWRNTAGNGLKNEGRQWPLKRVLFFPVVCLFEGRSALEGVVSEVVFFGRAEKRGFLVGIRGEPVAAKQDFHFGFVAGLACLCRVRDGFGVFKKGLLSG